MKRVCGHCQTVLGEKCGECGSTRVVLRQGIVILFWTCLDCDHRWFPGQEPVTTGICQECFEGEFSHLSIGSLNHSKENTDARAVEEVREPD